MSYTKDIISDGFVYLVNNTSKNVKSSKTRIPRSKDVVFDREKGCLTKEDCSKNIDSLLSAYRSVFRKITNVAIAFGQNYDHPGDEVGKYLAEVTVHAVNPENNRIWLFCHEITTYGSIIDIAGQRNAPWLWRFTYHQKCRRALAGWIKNVVESKRTKQRQLIRTSLFKEELMKVVWSK